MHDLGGSGCKQYPHSLTPYGLFLKSSHKICTILFDSILFKHRYNMSERKNTVNNILNILDLHTHRILEPERN